MLESSRQAPILRAITGKNGATLRAKVERGKHFPIQLIFTTETLGLRV